MTERNDYVRMTPELVNLQQRYGDVVDKVLQAVRRTNQLLPEKPVSREEADFGPFQAFYDEAKEIKDLRQLSDFLTRLQERESDYDSIVHEITSAMLATFHVMNEGKGGGITGFQAGYVGRYIMMEVLYLSGIWSIQRYENMLYPQYEYQYKQIPNGVLDWLTKEARKKLASEKAADFSSELRTHLEGIAEGKLPWGLQEME